MNQTESHATPQADLEETSTAPARPVLLAVECSQDSEAALKWACDYAEVVGAPLEILHVVHDPADSPGTYRPDEDDPLEPMADVARRRLTEFVDRIGRGSAGPPGLDGARLLCVEGLPAAKILDVAQARSARLVVLGGGRRNGIGGLLRGSIAHRVARRSPLPVTIVKADG